MKRILPILLILILLCSCSQSANPVETEGGRGPINSPSRWSQSPVALPIVGGRQETALSRVGCFQKITAEHSDGRTFIIQAEDNGAGAVLRLAVYESVTDGKTFTGGVDYVFRADTTIANGYTANEITDLREWSAVLRDDYIFIALINISGGSDTCQILRYNINAFTFDLLFAEVSPLVGNDLLKSVDIACSEAGPLRDDNERNVGHGSIWYNFITTDNHDPSLAATFQLWYRQVLSFISGAFDIQARGAGSAAAGGVGNGNLGQVSLFDGGNSIYSLDCFNPSGSNAFEDVFNLRVWHELLTTYFDPTGTLPIPEIYNLFLPVLISGALDQNNLLYDFGTWDACYIDRYDYQVQAKWIRNAAGTGWNLYIGRRNQNGVFTSNLIKPVDYGALGVVDIEVEVENTGNFPEVCISTDENGKVYVFFSFPDQTNNSLAGGALGDLDGNPYTNIEMMSFDGDEIYDPQGLDIQTIWNGFSEATIRSVKHLSAPHRTDSENFDISDVVLWFSARDNENDLRYVWFRN